MTLTPTASELALLVAASSLVVLAAAYLYSRVTIYDGARRATAILSFATLALATLALVLLAVEVFDL